MRLVGNGYAAPWVCEVAERGFDSETFRANARLIAAAPEMLAALRLAEQGLSFFVERAAERLSAEGAAINYHSLGEVRRAIAKATDPSGSEALGPSDRTGGPTGPGMNQNEPA